MLSRYLSVIAAGLIMAGSFMVLLRGGEKSVPAKIEPGSVLVSLQDSKSRKLEIVKGRAPLTRPWAELLHQAHMRGWKGSLNGSISGLRTYRDQLRLYRDFLRGEGAPAFHPDGPSRHVITNVRRQGQWYQAVDVSRPRELIRAAKKSGVDLYQPYADEPWHIEAQTPFILFRPGKEPGPPGTAPAPVMLPAIPAALTMLFLSLGMALRDRYGSGRFPKGAAAVIILGGALLIFWAGPAGALFPLCAASLLLPVLWPELEQPVEPEGPPDFF